MNPIILIIAIVIVVVVAIFAYCGCIMKANRLREQELFTNLIMTNDLTKNNQDLEDELFKILEDLSLKGIEGISEQLKFYLKSCLSNALRLRSLFGSIGNRIKDREKRKFLKDVYLFNVIRESQIENLTALYISCLEGGNSNDGHMMYEDEMKYLSTLVYQYIFGNNEREAFFPSVYKKMKKILAGNTLSEEERIILSAEKLKFFYAYRHFID